MAPNEVLRGEQVRLEGWGTAEDTRISVASDTTLDDELRGEGRGLDLIHVLNAMRERQGLALTDRILVRLPSGEHDLMLFRTA